MNEKWDLFSIFHVVVFCPKTAPMSINVVPKFGGQPQPIAEVNDERIVEENSSQIPVSLNRFT
jgi:hypothetical protein